MTRPLPDGRQRAQGTDGRAQTRVAAVSSARAIRSRPVSVSSTMLRRQPCELRRRTTSPRRSRPSSRATLMLIGGCGPRLLRLAAEHADVWNVPGPPHNSVGFVAGRARVLDAHCAGLGRELAEIVRSVQVLVSYDGPAATRATVLGLVRAGMNHVVLSLPRPYPQGVVRRLAEEVVAPVLTAVMA
ncbi:MULTISPECIES: hypothetical protein [unclassified Streptomyces]|uniref:hypothetical protein n=1 Tax=unclassified Streptomyces TaxID=2593676 RepID=UPI00371C84CF